MGNLFGYFLHDQHKLNKTKRVSLRWWRRRTERSWMTVKGPRLSWTWCQRTTDNKLSYETNRGCTQEGMSRIYFWDPWWRASVEHRALLWSGRATLKLGTPQTRIFAVQVSSEGCCCSLVQYFIQQLLLGLVCLQPAQESFTASKNLLWPSSFPLTYRLPSVITIHYIYSCYCQCSNGTRLFFVFKSSYSENVKWDILPSSVIYERSQKHEV